MAEKEIVNSITDEYWNRTCKQITKFITLNQPNPSSMFVKPSKFKNQLINDQLKRGNRFPSQRLLALVHISIHYLLKQGVELYEDPECPLIFEEVDKLYFNQKGSNISKHLN